MTTQGNSPVMLKPCPFCGKPPRSCPDTSYGSATVFCPDENECEVSPVADADLNAGETLGSAVERWNTRLSSNDVLVDALRGAARHALTFIENRFSDLSPEKRSTVEHLRQALASIQGAPVRDGEATGIDRAFLRQQILADPDIETEATPPTTDVIEAGERDFPTDEQIKHMVNRFLSWKLPEAFNPDGGISFQRTFNTGTPHEFKAEPFGTNLFDATQAEVMVRHMVEATLPEPAPTATAAFYKRDRAECSDDRRAAVRAAIAAISPSPVEADAFERAGIYVASRASIPERGQMWRDLRASGVKVSSTWIDEDGEGETGDWSELWQRIEREVKASEALILYAEPDDFPLKGAFVEAGIAISAGVPVFVVAPGVALGTYGCRPIGSWASHPLVSYADSVETAIRNLKGEKALAERSKS